MKVTAIAAVILCLTVCGSSGLSAKDNANRTLLGNQAVRDDLQLTGEQREKIDAILTEMEQEIAKKVAAAKQAGQDEDAQARIAGEVVEQFGPAAQELLDKTQEVRFWQIGAQASGPAIFNNNRTRRLLHLTPRQLRQMSALSETMVQNVTRVATDPTIDIAKVQDEAERQKQLLFDGCVALLTAEQRKDFDELLGKPFDLDLLANAAGKKPRPMTFVFGLTWQNPYYLLADPKLQLALGLSAEQREQLQALLKQDDQRLTAVRLRALKQHAADFSQLSDTDKLQVAKSILDGGAEVFRESNAQVQKLLTDKQASQLDRRLVRQIGVRAIGSDRIAKALKLTDQQQAAFAQACARLDERTAVMRVVRSQKAFDHRKFDAELKTLDAAVGSILAPAQLKELDAFKQD